VKTFNEKVAVKGTLLFGSMWTTYALFLYGFLPILFPKYMDTFLYWSNTVQLWSLPLLMVGQVVLGRAAEKRAVQDHKTLLAEMKELKQMHKELREFMRSKKEDAK
jgi:hypothetical protein